MKLSIIIVTTLLLASTVFCQCNVQVQPCSEQCIDLGFFKDLDPNQSCAAPTNCLSGAKCNDTQSACSLIGYQSQKGVCVAPTDQECLTPRLQLCQNYLSVCMTQNGFNAPPNSYTCQSPHNCLQSNSGLCSDKRTYCKSLGFSKSSTSNDCVCDTSKYQVDSNQCIPKSNSFSYFFSYSFIIYLVTLLI